MARLHRVLYVSNATGSTDSLLGVATILGKSQRNNARRDLTGVLAAHRGTFIPVIEGPADAIDRLLERLCCDPRHRDLRVLDRAPVERRTFEAWSMASARITTGVEPLLDRVVEGLEACPDKTIEALRAIAA
jgi:hypothetical protein